MAARLPSSVEIDDLIQAGSIGLMEAASNFDASHGASFNTYATIRIRGAMLDEVRRSDWSPRSHRRRMRELSDAIHAVESRHGREARESEIIEELGVTPEKYRELLRDSCQWSIGSLEDLQDRAGDAALPQADHEQLPDRHAEDGAAAEALATAIEGLPEREQLIMSLYYEQDMNLKEIGAVIGVSESRICQLHGQILARLRARLSSHRG